MTSIPRQLRVEFPGAIYHLMSRGDRREDIFLNDVEWRVLRASANERVGRPQWASAAVRGLPYVNALRKETS
jgi:hypothetical protein